VKKLLILPVFIMIVSLILAGCSSSKPPISTQANTPATPNKTSVQPSISATQSSGNSLKFKTFKYVDSQGTGIEAFQLLVPTDWQAEANISWVLDNPGMPASSNLRVWNPKGDQEFDVFPNQSFFSTTNPMLAEMFPTGSKYFGMEVLQQFTPQEALHNIVIPRFLGDISDFKVTNEGPVSSLENTANSASDPASGISGSSSGAKIRIEYNENGNAMECEIYCMVESITFPVQTVNGIKSNTDWYVDHIAAFKAKKGQLESNTKLFQTMANSLKLNPVWFSKYNQVVAFLIQNQIKQIQDVGQLSQIISQTNDQISDEMMQSYNNRQAVDDKISQDFSQYIRGVDAYNDPISGNSVELPSGYDNAWTNSNGEYVVSESPSFNPNVGSNLDWQPLTKK
jgi:hypothetical protein